MAKEKQVIDSDEWDGPVLVNDRYFDDIDDAVEYYWDDAYNTKEGRFVLEDVPEFAECCDSSLPTCDPVDWIVENIDENYLTDDNNFSDYVSEGKRAELHQVIQGWIESVGWHYYTGNNKYIALRPLVDDYAKECDRRDRLSQAMDYAGS